MNTIHPNHGFISSEDVEGTSVYDRASNKIGEIDHLMIDKISGRVIYAVLSFGGLLGLGHNHYPLPWAKLNYDKQLDGYRTDVNEAQLKDSPEYSDDSWDSRDWESKLHDYYGQPPYWAL